MKLRCFLLLSLLSGNLLSRSQTFEAALAAYNPGPEVFIHHDQQTYVPGETIWFKAYVTEKGLPFPRNTNLFVRLLSPSGEVLSEQLFPVNGAVARGSIDLAPGLSNGVYLVQVLINDMLASGKFRQFAIPVSRTSQFKKEENQLTVKFYPESGALIPGIQNRLAFTAEENGRPVMVTGLLREKGGTGGTKFQTYHRGLGSFEFMPVAGKLYEAEIEWQGSRKIFDLPSTTASGIQLRVEDGKEGKSFLLSRVASSPTENAVITLVAEINGIVVYEQEIAFEDYPSLKGGLLTGELPSGILHFTVFSKDRKILAERLSFVNNGEYRLHGEIFIKKYSQNPRSKQELELQVNSAKNFSGSLAIIQGATPGDNIISDLLLSSRLKKRIDQPAWYLEENDSSRAALDILLQTQRLNGPEWDLVLAGTNRPTPSTGQPDFISVSGVVKDKDGEKTMGPGRLNFYLEAEDLNTLNYTTRTDENGRFRLDSMEFSGKANLYYAFTDLNEKQPAVKLQGLEQNFPLRVKLPFVQLETPTYEDGNSKDLEIRIGQLKNHDEQVKILERVTLNARKKRPTDLVEEKYATGVFRMQAAKTLDNINEPSRDGSMSVVDYIRNRINEVELTGGGFVNRKTLSMETATKWAVGVFLDESLTNMAILRSIRVSEVALIKFFDVGWVGVGSSYPGGAIAVFTKKESDVAPPRPPKLEYVGIHGFNISKNFLHIDYGQKDMKHPARDHRHTLYWNPDINLTPASNSFRFSYYNNDLQQEKKRLIFQGINSEGKLLYLEKVLE